MSLQVPKLTAWLLDDPSSLSSLCDDAEWAEEATADARQNKDQNENGNADAYDGSNTEKEQNWRHLNKVLAQVSFSGPKIFLPKFGNFRN